MIAAMDVAYRGRGALAACVLFPAWDSPAPVREVVEPIARVEPYLPGRFFLRELPCLLALLGRVEVPLSAVVIDGYVWLDASGRPGLGAYLFRALGEQVPVIGVAKRPFAGSAHAVPVLRGTGHRPLYVTSAGMAPSEAAGHLAQMHGPHRLPSLLRRVDRLARGEAPAR